MELCTDQEVQQSRLATRLWPQDCHHEQLLMILYLLEDPAHHCRKRCSLDSIDVSIDNLHRSAIFKALSKDSLKLLLRFLWLWKHKLLYFPQEKLTIENFIFNWGIDLIHATLDTQPLRFKCIILLDLLNSRSLSDFIRRLFIIEDLLVYLFNLSFQVLNLCIVIAQPRQVAGFNELEKIVNWL